MAACYEEAFSFITEVGKKGDIDHDSVMAPFFSQSPDNSDTQDQLDFLTAKVNDLVTTSNIPPPLARLYKIMGHPAREYYFGDWIFMSLDKIITMKNAKEKEGQMNVVDFAVLYMGMGHCIIAAMDPRDDKIFYRHDGGSNGWEREDNFKNIVKYESNNGQKFSFKHWMNLTKMKETNPFDINKQYSVTY